MIPIKKSLLTRTILGFSIYENEGLDLFCSVKISGEYVLSTHSLLRYVGKDGFFLTSEDHKQQFGLPSPINAEREIEEKIEGKEIVDVTIDMNTGDLRLKLDDGCLEVICNSSGYEQFELNGPDCIMVGMGGKQDPNKAVVWNSEPLRSQNPTL